MVYFRRLRTLIFYRKLPGNWGVVARKSPRSEWVKQGKMGTETSKIALNAHVHLRTANQQMSRPERHVDDITDMRRSCRHRENTSCRRPLRSSSRLLKVPIFVPV